MRAVASFMRSSQTRIRDAVLNGRGIVVESLGEIGAQHLAEGRAKRIIGEHPAITNGFVRDSCDSPGISNTRWARAILRETTMASTRTRPTWNFQGNFLDGNLWEP